MKKIIRLKKGLAIVLTAAMVAGLAPAMTGGANEVQAATEDDTKNTPSVSTYATKEQLMDGTFAPDENGEAVNYGKLYFGKNLDGKAQDWYILGRDNDVPGDNTIIFAASSMGDVSRFDRSYYNKTFDSSFGVYESDPSEVYPSHYGASELRGVIQSIATNVSYFTTGEQNLMNATTVKTWDILNEVYYTTTDTLYVLTADGFDAATIKAGTSDSTVLAMKSYWDGKKGYDCVWLRAPYQADKKYPREVLVAYPGSRVGCGDIHYSYDHFLRPASNLDLSSVLFASGATATASDTAVAGIIKKDENTGVSSAMTLRLDGSSKNIGTVTYNTETGDIKATKGSTKGSVALVVQGNDGTNDWYYSKVITGTEIVDVSDVKERLNTSASIDLSACKIWLETTSSTKNLTYAVEATETPVQIIHSVAITGMETPTANTALATTASCETKGVSSTRPQITWTPNASTAGYNTSYTASITLTADKDYEFNDSTKATVLGNAATSVTKNTDGTFTVTYDFPATAKRVIAGVTVPAVPTTFTTYYGYDGYGASPVSGSNRELGKTATVTFTDSMKPNTEAMAVTWTIASAGGIYDKTPGATNTFRWTIPASKFANYNVGNCKGYDSKSGTITGTVTIANKTATPVNITGTDSSIAYTGAAIDVSGYFTIDSNAGTATYTLITGADGGTGKGSLSGTTLTVTKTGTFKIKVETAAKGIYGAGEKIITLTVDNEAGYKVTDVAKKEVVYQTPANKNATTISVPDTVTIDGVTYKVTSIADNAFKNNKKITTVTIGSNIKIIGANAFSGCSKLTSVTIGSNATTISDKAFYKCTALTKITIPAKVTKLGKQAFNGCKKLKTITIKTTKLTSKNVGSSAFKGIHNKASIKVPKSKLKAYKTMLKKKGIGKAVKVKK